MKSLAGETLSLAAVLLCTFWLTKSLSEQKLANFHSSMFICVQVDPKKAAPQGKVRNCVNYMVYVLYICTEDFVFTMLSFL